MFVDEREQEVSIDGFDQPVVIRPLSAKAQDLLSFSDEKERDTVDAGLVRIGDRRESDWSSVLTREAVHAISAEIWRLTA